MVLEVLLHLLTETSRLVLDTPYFVAVAIHQIDTRGSRQRLRKGASGGPRPWGRRSSMARLAPDDNVSGHTHLELGRTADLRVHIGHARGARALHKVAGGPSHSMTKSRGGGHRLLLRCSRCAASTSALRPGRAHATGQREGSARRNGSARATLSPPVAPRYASPVPRSARARNRRRRCAACPRAGRRVARAMPRCRPARR